MGYPRDATKNLVRCRCHVVETQQWRLIRQTEMTFPVGNSRWKWGISFNQIAFQKEFRKSSRAGKVLNSNEFRMDWILSRCWLNERYRSFPKTFPISGLPLSSLNAPRRSVWGFSACDRRNGSHLRPRSHRIRIQTNIRSDSIVIKRHSMTF